MKYLYIMVCRLFFFNSFVYAENFLNTTRVIVTEDLTEAVKVAKDIKKSWRLLLTGSMVLWSHLRVPQK